MTFDAFTYRFYLVAQNLGVARLLQRMPVLALSARRFRRLVLADTPKWRKVRSGISKGLWMRLQLPQQGRLWCGEHEVTVQRDLLAAITPGAVFYDVGAHLGSIALGAARLASRSGRVVAFEADPENVKNLESNAIRNHLTSSLQIVSGAVWFYSATAISFRCGGTNSTHGGVETDGQSPVLSAGEMINVPSIALDDFVAHGGPIPHVIKIDVEGGEYEVLRGGAELFAKHRPLIVVEVHHEQAAAQIYPWLARFRYGSRWIIPAERFPSCLFAWPEEFDGAAWMERSGLSSESPRTA